MKQCGIMLHFPRAIADQPIISQMIRSYALEVNILQASITSSDDGKMFLIVRGPAADIDHALAFLKSRGVGVAPAGKKLIHDRDLCVHCGACSVQCLSGALKVNPQTGETELDEERCLACGMCLPSCGYGALQAAHAESADIDGHHDGEIR